MLVSRLRCLTLKERQRKIRNEASQKRREKWKRGYYKSRKSTTKRCANRADPSSNTEVTGFWKLVHAAGNNSKLTPLRLRILNLAQRDRDHLLLFICWTLSSRSENFCQVSYQGKLLFHICNTLIFVTCLSEIGSKPETAVLPTNWTKYNVSDVFGNVGTLSKVEKGLVKVWDLFYG